MTKRRAGRLWSILLAVFLVFSILPVTVFAEGGNEAKIGETEYATLEEAVKNCKEGQTIELLQNVTVESPITIDKTLTLNLGKYTITHEAYRQELFHVTGGHFTVTADGGGIRNQPDESNEDPGPLVQLSPGAKGLTVKGGSYTGTVQSSGLFCSDGLVPSLTNVTIENVTFTVDDGEMAAVLDLSNVYNSNLDVNISNCNFTTSINHGSVITLDAGTIAISNVTIDCTLTANDDASCLSLSRGPVDLSATLSGNNFSINGGSKSSAIKLDRGADVTIEGGSYSASSSKAYGVFIESGNPTLKIEGGTFTGTGTNAGAAVQVESDASPTITISGGSFSSSVKKYVVEEELPVELMNPGAEDKKTYSYYKDVTDAAAMAADGAVITKTDDSSSDTGKTVTLNYNDGTGKTVTMKTSQDTITLPALTRSGYAFSGWSDGSGELHQEGSYTLQDSGNVLTAQWQAQSSGTSPVLPPSSSTGSWQQNPIGWWYKDPDGSWPANQWRYLDTGKGYKAWYWFDQNGYITFGWQYIYGSWYYLNRSGEMQTGWQFVNNKWYYLDQSGAMVTGWVQDGDKWYYMDQDGSMHFGWLSWAGYWYHLDSHGAMSTGWNYLGGKWYYLYPDTGRMAANGYTPDGYLVDASGAWIQ